MDHTGCGHDLVGKSEVKAKALKKAEPEECLVLSTANGPAPVEQVAEMTVKELLEDIRPLVLEETPSVLSIGRRCMRYGYGFYWRPGRKPILVTPKGRRIKLHVEGDIPYLIVGNDPACPTVIAFDSGNDVAAPTANHPEAVAQAPAENEMENEVVEVAVETEEVAQLPEKKENKLRKAATSVQHMLTHMPSNPFCKICSSAKMRQSGAYTVKDEDKRVAKVFGERVHGDLCFPCDQKDEPTDQEREDSKVCAFVVKDDASECTGFYPLNNRKATSLAEAMRHFIGPNN